MKNRSLITTILSVVVLAMLVVFIIALFAGQNSDPVQFIAYKICLPVAILAILGIDIILPIMDNYKRFKSDNKLLILTIVKVVLFIAAFVLLVGYTNFKFVQTNNEILILIAFAVLYFASFFISIDPKRPKIDRTDEPKESDEDELDSGEDEDTDDEEDTDDGRLYTHSVADDDQNETDEDDLDNNESVVTAVSGNVPENDISKKDTPVDNDVPDNNPSDSTEE
jgi:hypothetical protein